MSSFNLLGLILLVGTHIQNSQELLPQQYSWQNGWYPNTNGGLVMNYGQYPYANKQNNNYTPLLQGGIPKNPKYKLQNQAFARQKIRLPYILDVGVFYDQPGYSFKMYGRKAYPSQCIAIPYQPRLLYPLNPWKPINKITGKKIKRYKTKLEAYICRDINNRQFYALRTINYAVTSDRRRRLVGSISVEKYCNTLGAEGSWLPR